MVDDRVVAESEERNATDAIASDRYDIARRAIDTIRDFVNQKTI